MNTIQAIFGCGCFFRVPFVTEKPKGKPQFWEFPPPKQKKNAHTHTHLARKTSGRMNSQQFRLRLHLLLALHDHRANSLGPLKSRTVGGGGHLCASQNMGIPKMMVFPVVSFKPPQEVYPKKLVYPMYHSLRIARAGFHGSQTDTAASTVASIMAQEIEGPSLPNQAACNSFAKKCSAPSVFGSIS